MPNSDFLAQPSLPRPEVGVDDAAAVAESAFGLTGRVSELGSNQDRNFLVQTDAGRYVLKIANPVFSADELRAQNAALALLADADARIPAVLPARDGAEIVAVDVRGRTLNARVLGFLDGEPLTDVGRLSSEQLRTLGRLSGSIAAGLAGLRHPGLARTTQWDARIGGDVVALLAEHVLQPTKRQAVVAAAEAALAALEPLRRRLRVQAIHGDVTDDNIVLGADGPGVIDFGDVAEGWLVAELAATVTSALHHQPEDPLAVLDVIEAFHAESPLDDADLAALWPLVVLRGAVLVVSGEQQVALDGDNTYADENRAHEWVAFDAARRLPAREVEAAIRARLGAAGAHERTAPPVGRLIALDSTDAHLADLSVTAHDLDDGRWQRAGFEDAVLERICREHGHALTRYAEARLTRASLDRTAPSATIALAVTLDVPAGTVVHAPFAGELRLVDGAWLLHGDDLDLWLDGLSHPLTTASVDRGEVIGSAVRLTAQLSRVPGRRPPAFVTPALPAAVWSAVSPDSSGLFGVDLAAPAADPADVLSRRDSTFARVQEHYFAEPPLIERGWGHHLFDTRAQSYLDMVNNVTQIGHAHPRLVRAVRDQWALLNTNSRFHYEELSRFTERLAEVAPDGLDTVFLVNSGSEAVDLALRLGNLNH